MPTITRFFGIVIEVHAQDAAPPSFTATYAGHEVTLGIAPLRVLHGDLPPRALGMAFEWAAIHQAELAANWKRVTQQQPPRPIASLDGVVAPGTPRRVQAVRHLHDYVLELTFTDGTVAPLDFRNDIVDQGGVFAPLQEVTHFRQVGVDPDLGTIVWPNGADFCPDVLYHRATGAPLPGQSAREAV